MKLLLSSILLLFGLVAPAVAGAPAVEVFSKHSNGAGGGIHATGVYIGQGRVVTAAHNIGKELQVARTAASPRHAAKVLKVDEGNDIAILSIEEPNPFEWVGLRCTKPALGGEPVRLIGFPEGVPVETSGEVFGNEVGQPAPVKVGQILKDGIEGEEFFIAAPSGPGFSGGPVLDTNGHAVGIMIEDIPAKNMTIAIPVDTVCKMLNLD
jgi:S1-C subfamily serine protease